MVYIEIIPLGVTGLLQVTSTASILIPVTVLMIGGVEAVDSYYEISMITYDWLYHTCFECCDIFSVT